MIEILVCIENTIYCCCNNKTTLDATGLKLESTCHISCNNCFNCLEHLVGRGGLSPVTLMKINYYYYCCVWWEQNLSTLWWESNEKFVEIETMEFDQSTLPKWSLQNCKCHSSLWESWVQQMLLVVPNLLWTDIWWKKMY